MIYGKKTQSMVEVLERQGLIPSVRAGHKTAVLLVEVQWSDETTVSRIRTSVFPVVVQPIPNEKLTGDSEELAYRFVHAVCVAAATSV